MLDGDKPLTTGQIGELCNVNYKTVLNWINRNRLKAYRLPGGDHRVNVKDFIAFCKEFGMPLPGILQESVMRVLVVDDEKNILSAFKRAFTEDHFEIRTAESGFQAGVELPSFKPHAVVLDINMPKIDGVEVARWIKQGTYGSGTKIFVVSGFLDADTKSKLSEIGVDRMHEKPMDVDLIKREIVELCAI